jgi:hypothetical protein
MPEPRPHGYNAFAAGYCVVGLVLLVGALIILLAGGRSQAAAGPAIGWLLLAAIFGGLAAALAGLGLWRGRRWGYLLAVALAVALLPLAPVGTALGVFLLWYLLARVRPLRP